MKTCLLDVNVLLALAWPHHVHHGTVHAWWETACPVRWATCTLTQLGFVRVSCNARFCPVPATPAKALDVLRRMIARPDHDFWAEIPAGLSDAAVSKRISESLGHGQVTDSYLAVLAGIRGGSLVTLDRALAAGYPDVAVLLSSAPA
jgi:toxin-antitoxin system PIN domain toxin